MWYHGAGNEVESTIINQIVADFNASQSDWSVSLESFPQGAYNDSVVAVALAGNLPDILDVDGPVMPNWAWAGYMQPLPLDEAVIVDSLPGTKGYWDGQLYSIGLWDAAVALVTHRSTLDALDRAMRDPWVMRDPDGKGWLMYFTARAPGIEEPNAGGAIGFATSDDLHNWTLQPPVFVGGYGQLEVPQVFKVAGRWYCLFCTAAEHFSKAQASAIPGGPVTGIHYLIGDNPRGPWTIAPGPFLDGALPRRRYAARIVETDAGLRIMGFADKGADGQFQGVILDPEPVDVLDDGRLIVRAHLQATE